MAHPHQEHLHAARKWLSDDPAATSRLKSTAVYFEWLAKKETCAYDRRQRLLEVARFYRSLAVIISAMSTGIRSTT